MDCRDWEVWPKGLAPMDQGNREEQVRLRSMDYQGHVKLWRVPYHSYETMKSTISFMQNMTNEQRVWCGWLHLRWPLFIMRKMMEMEVGWYEVWGLGYVSNLCQELCYLVELKVRTSKVFGFLGRLPQVLCWPGFFLLGRASQISSPGLARFGLHS
jgi:hypothetical protein